MKRLENIVLTYQDVCKAVESAANGHRGERQVEQFYKSFEDGCAGLFAKLQDGSWRDDLSYSKLEKVNTNGKRRKIDSPTFRTRIYQHLLLNILEPFYSKKDNLNGLNFAAEKEYGKEALLPLEEAEIENQCGYIFKGSTNQLIYIENEIN